MGDPTGDLLPGFGHRPHQREVQGSNGTTTMVAVCHDEGKTTSFMRNEAEPIDSAARGTHLG
jgi:hypothetical protein